MKNDWQLWGIFQQGLECAVYTNEPLDDVVNHCFVLVVMVKLYR